MPAQIHFELFDPLEGDLLGSALIWVGSGPSVQDSFLGLGRAATERFSATAR